MNTEFDKFEAEFRRWFAQLMKYAPGTVGSQDASIKLGEMEDSNPAWAEIVLAKITNA